VHISGATIFLEKNKSTLSKTKTNYIIVIKLQKHLTQPDRECTLLHNCNKLLKKKNYTSDDMEIGTEKPKTQIL
jgi:hypothetical protein